MTENERASKSCPDADEMILLWCVNRVCCIDVDFAEDARDEPFFPAVPFGTLVCVTERGASALEEKPFGCIGVLLR